MQLGLKVWSTNPAAHRRAAIELAEQNLCQYIEIYTVPGSGETTIPFWKEIPLPKILHAPHFNHRFNFADAGIAADNARTFAEVQRFADELDARWIICHCGTGGTPEETIRQIAALHDERIILENKTFQQNPTLFPGCTSDLHCRGAVFEEFSAIQKALRCHTCHDLAHTVCMANSLHLDCDAEIRKFESLHPVIHHLSDLTTADDQFDNHEGIGQGKLDWVHLLKMIPGDAWLTLETPKSSNENLDSFVSEIKLIRGAGF